MTSLIVVLQERAAELLLLVIGQLMQYADGFALIPGHVTKDGQCHNTILKQKFDVLNPSPLYSRPPQLTLTLAFHCPVVSGFSCLF